MRQFSADSNWNYCWMTQLPIYFDSLWPVLISYDQEQIVFLLVCYLTMFQYQDHSVNWQNDRWLINYKGFERKQSWPNQGTILAEIWSQIQIQINTLGKQGGADYLSILMTSNPSNDNLCFTKPLYWNVGSKQKVYRKRKT
jgi:hypothetical protein